MLRQAWPLHSRSLPTSVGKRPKPPPTTNRKSSESDKCYERTIELEAGYNRGELADYSGKATEV